MTQSASIKEIGCDAFAEALESLGLDCNPVKAEQTNRLTFLEKESKIKNNKRQY